MSFARLLRHAWVQLDASYSFFPFWVSAWAHGSISLSPWTREKVLKHVRQQLFESSVTAVTGEVLPINLKDHDVSIGCHSDSPGWYVARPLSVLSTNIDEFLHSVEIVKATREVVDQFNSKFF